MYRGRAAKHYGLHDTRKQQKNWETIGKAGGEEMEEYSGGEPDDYTDAEEVVPAVEEEIHPKDGMDPSNLERVGERGAKTRAVATIHSGDDTMGIPEGVEAFY